MKKKNYVESIYVHKKKKEKKMDLSNYVGKKKKLRCRGNEK